MLQVLSYTLNDLNPSTVFNIFFKENAKTIDSIQKIAKNILITSSAIAVSIALCYYQPFFFVGGFFTGLFFKNELKEKINRIQEVWDQHIGVKLGLAFFGFITLPITSSFLSAWLSAKWAIYLHPDNIQGGMPGTS
ncbi:hypothetical protein N9Y92_01735 [Chlamydiales bacterium]|nr:hypothetical protein [Chlamydiales bacterium]